jgi:hypothetical protein
MRTTLLLLACSFVTLFSSNLSAQPALSSPKCSPPCKGTPCVDQCSLGACGHYCAKKEIVTESAPNQPSVDIHILNVQPQTAAKIKELLEEREGATR